MRMESSPGNHLLTDLAEADSLPIFSMVVQFRVFGFQK